RPGAREHTRAPQDHRQRSRCGRAAQGHASSPSPIGVSIEMTPAGAWIDAGCFVADAVGALLPSTLSAMRIQCPNCPASYELDDGRVPPAGLSIKCPKCKTPFTVHRPKPGERKAVTSKVPLPGTGTPAPGQPAQRATCGRVPLPGAQFVPAPPPPPWSGASA